MPTYSARVQISDWHDDHTSFTAQDDQEAIAAGLACHQTVCHGYRQDPAQVRVRVYTLELGPWDGQQFRTSTDRQLLDTQEP